MKTTETDSKRLHSQIKAMIILFIILLILSGITAFPLEWEMSLLNGSIDLFPPSLRAWFARVYEGVKETNLKHPFMAYGTDWLAFAHISIAVYFIGPLLDPVKNKWVIKAGMITSLMVFPLAWIAGSYRGIPFGWQLIDCSFGVFSFLLLGLCLQKINKLEMLEKKRTFSKLVLS